jgi:parallel beta-helix repeat protein
MKQLRKELALVLMFLFLIPLTSLPSTNGQAQSQQVTITPDGNIVGTEKIEKNGNIYTLKGDLNSEVKILKDNIVFDGAGFKISGSDQIIFTEGGFNEFSGTKNKTAINIEGRANVTIKNVCINGYKVGIGIYKSLFTVISGNIFSQDNNPIYIENSSYNLITDNEITTVSYYAFILRSSDSNIISKNNVQNGSGILISSGSANLVAQNNFTHGSTAVSVISSNNQIIGNNISQNERGISLQVDSSNNFFSRNIFSKNSVGIDADEMVIKNITFTENTFIENKQYTTLGLNSENSYRFYQNNFINNSQNVGFAGEYFYSGDTPPQYTSQLIENHNWDNGDLGNYWSDYTNKYPNATSDKHGNICNSLCCYTIKLSIFIL